MTTIAIRPAHPIRRPGQKLPGGGAPSDGRPRTGGTGAFAAQQDEALLDAARVGDTGAVEQLYRRHRSTALAVAARHTTPDYPAQDLAADAMVGMLRALARGDGPRTSVPGYLAVSVRNLAAHASRRRKHAAYAQPTPTESLHNVAADSGRSDQPEHAVLEAETRRQLATAFARLQPNARQILCLLHVEDLTVRECADQLGISSEAVRAMSYRARKALRRHYQDLWPDAAPSC